MAATTIRLRARCLEDRALILEIVAGMQNKNNAIVIDCAEVLTQVAKVQPAWIAPYGQMLPALLNNKNNRARWEGMHCLALTADLIPHMEHKSATVKKSAKELKALL